MLRHTESPDMVRTVYSCILNHIQQHSAIFSNEQSYLGTSRHIQAFSSINEAYQAIVRHIQNSV